MNKRIDIKVTFNCNNHCYFCVQGRKREYYKPKSLDEIFQELNIAFREGYREVVFTGGEPTLHKDILQIVAEAKRIGYKNIQIQTNGRMFYYKDFCTKIINAGMTEFSPAIHGSNSKIHDFLTNSKGSFKETVTGIINVRKISSKIPIITNTVITKPNTFDLPNIAKLLVSLKVTQFQLAFVHILGSAAENSSWLIPKKSVAEPFVKKALDIGISSQIKVMTEAIPYCFMKGYENYVAEEIIPSTKIIDADRTIKSYELYRKKEGKIKSEKCKKCKFFDKCEGPWKEYPKLFGWHEFIPIK
jgi:radical SAM protein with 4Fe4S-binding SPASM domain